MKKIILLFFIVLMCSPAYAGRWNRYPYQAMSDRSYRENYSRQVNYRTVPYTQNRNGYSYNNMNYSSYTNSMNTYNINRMNGGYRR